MPVRQSCSRAARRRCGGISVLFNSYIFVLLFLPLCVAGYFVLNKWGAAWRARRGGRGDGYNAGRLWLLGMSLWFYAWFNPRYLPLIVASVLLNYGASRWMLAAQSCRLRAGVLAAALAANLGLLGYYKYAGFFIQNLNALFGSGIVFPKLLLPLGISFFTFQQLSYVIDSYRRAVPAYNILDYALFVTFFPQLVAGPIVTHDEMVPQFADPAKKRPQAENLAKGIMAFAFGLAKKVILADSFGNAVNWGYARAAELDATNTLLVILFFTFQIYFDFSGYCDMATGIGLMFNVHLPMNFSSPYRALNIGEFWERWHMTLTRFFTRYVYIPLGGSHKGRLRTAANTMAVFLISGLWHGASWTFVFWGGLHGAAAVLTRLFRPRVQKLHPALGWLGTFAFVNLAWVFFRAESFTEAGTLLYNLFKLDFGPIRAEIASAFILPEFSWLIKPLGLSGFMGRNPALYLAGFTLFGLVAVLGMKNTHERLAAFKPRLRTGLASVGLLWWCILSFASVSTFLYFNF